MENTNKRDLDRLRAQGTELIPAIAYGDAAGLPVETKTAAYILEKYGVIDALIPTKENPFYGVTEQPGTWSDDTQLTLAVARALIKANGFDMSSLVTTHLEAYDETAEIMRKGKLVKRGWGGSTSAAMEKLHDGVDPAETGTVEGAGNGVLMKMAPLAYWQSVRHTPLLQRFDEYDQLTTMTHDSQVARMTTRIHGDMLAYLLRETFSKSKFMNVLEASIVTHEFRTRKYPSKTPLGTMRKQIEYLYGNVTKETILAETDAKGFYAPQTLAMAYGAFIAHDGEFTSSVYEAVNLGGDTDSLASIVASMSVFASKEPIVMPPDFEHLEQLSELQSVSRQLAATALKD